MDAIERFERWFSQSGHWVYQSRSEALATWLERGIEGLPDYPQSVAAIGSGYAVRVLADGTILRD